MLACKAESTVTTIAGGANQVHHLQVSTKTNQIKCNKSNLNFNSFPRMCRRDDRNCFFQFFCTLDADVLMKNLEQHTHQKQLDNME